MFFNSVVFKCFLSVSEYWLKYIMACVLSFIIVPWMLCPSTEQTWIPFTQRCFVPSLVENGPVVLENKMKMWKVYRQTDGQKDKRQSEKLNWAFIHLIYKLNTFLITSANVSLRFFSHFTFGWRHSKNWTTGTQAITVTWVSKNPSKFLSEGLLSAYQQTLHRTN